MQSLFAVKNKTQFPVISAYIDEKRIFNDILRGEMSEYVPLTCGSARLLVLNNHEKPILDKWISVFPAKKIILEIGKSSLKLICT